MLWLLVTIVGFFAFSYLVLRGEDLSYLDKPLPQHPNTPESPELREALSVIRTFGAQEGGMPLGKERLRQVREFMDGMSSGREFECEFEPVNNAEVRGEWVLAKGSSSKRRLLYIHGGAFMAGSPTSHRAITDRLARLTGASVFAMSYRLMPEHRRLRGIEDCRNAYRWILENGPEGLEDAEWLVVAGDSAGGNLTLTTLAWVRDQGLRQADAGIAFAPATDSALDAPSLRANAATDAMLGPAFGKLVRLPNVLLLWYTWLTARMMPSDPRISPVRGNLQDLPPILIQVSDSEMLLDDARRYTAKAQAAESPVVLQTWPAMPHVFQFFTPTLPEAEESFSNVAEFLETVSSEPGAEKAA
ncbi:MAG: alpha/beta hydrolase [Pseudomonadota bacterium]